MMEENLSKEPKVEQIPCIQFKGTHFTCFENVGRAFKELIQMGVKMFDDDVSKWKKEFPELLPRFVEKVKKYPDVDQEIQGLARGAEVTYDDIMIFQVWDEIETWGRKDFGIDNPPEDHCSDVMVNGRNHFIGHNEDNSSEMKGIFHLLDLTIENENGEIKERFVHYSFPALIAGRTYAFNFKGIVLTGNSLTPRKYSKNGIPFFIIPRLMLSCHSIDECVQVMTVTKNRTYGFAMNIGSYNELGRMICCEFCTNKTCVYELEREHVFCRTNNYVLLRDKEYLVGPNSKARKERLDELMTTQQNNMGLIDLKKALGDEKDEKNPIYRRNGKTLTFTTCIFDLDEKRLLIYNQNPKNSEPISVIKMN